MPQVTTIRPFDSTHSTDVRALFVTVNRLLAPQGMESVFEEYITRSLAEEIDRISGYYAERDGQFWVALREEKVVGMFGLEPAGEFAMELRRMYVDPDCRRQGIARIMLNHAETYCQEQGIRRLDLSTSEIQSDALRFYRQSGYELVREAVANEANNKTIGGGVRRYHFKKNL